jgi:hypothetical protein
MFRLAALFSYSARIPILFLQSNALLELAASGAGNYGYKWQGPRISGISVSANVAALELLNVAVAPKNAFVATPRLAIGLQCDEQLLTMFVP